MMWLGVLCAASAADLAIRGQAVHPVAGPVIDDGVVLIEGDRITAVGPAAAVAIPEGTRVLEGAVVTPGLIDGLATAGLTGILNHLPDQDHRETAAPVVPELRALDGFDPWEPLVGWVREHGITTLQVGPSPGPVVAGRTAVVASHPTPAGARVWTSDGWVVISLGQPPKQQFADEGARSRMGAAALARQALAEAAEYAGRRRLGVRDRPTVDLGLEALAEAVAGQRRVVVHAHRADDLLTALRLADEFSLDVVLAGAAEGYLVRDVLAEAGVPVLVGPVMIRGWRNGERAHASFRNAARLADAGVLVGFMSGYESYVPKVRVVLWEAAIAAAHGLGPDRALRALTADAAAILGLEQQVGTLAPGLRADVAIFDGDPFEYTSHVCAVVAAGKVVSETCR